MKHHHKEKGFSLLEVMIAIGILAVSLLALFGLQSTSLIGSARAQRIAVSTELARHRMTQALIDIEQGIGKGEFPDDKEEAGTFEEEKFPDYLWKLSIKKVEIPSPPAAEGAGDIMAKVWQTVSEELTKMTREVKLTVSWKEDGFDEEEVGIVLTTHVVKFQ